ncbi:MAG: hypothetical protein AAFX90_18610 [Pseudomonadota bacterium]
MADHSVFEQSSILVSDQKTDQILLLRDLDGDGSASAEQEVSTFFDHSNLSGFSAPTANVFSLHQGSDGAIFVGDGQSDAIYRLRDLNGDSDAQDAGEAQLWFSADNAASLPFVTPNGMWQGADGALYVANAGTPVEPADAIYRLVDLNGDGDANDADEAVAWLDLSDSGSKAVPFSISFDGDVAYINDLAGVASQSVYRLEDLNGDGTISAAEVLPFVSADMAFSSALNVASLTVADEAVFALSWQPHEGNTIHLFRLEDIDGSGQIDEVAEIWNSLTLPVETKVHIAYSVAADTAGDLSISAYGFDGSASILRLHDVNQDQDFMDSGEATLFGSSTFTQDLFKPRAVEFYEGAQPFLASNPVPLVEDGLIALAVAMMVQRFFAT